MVLGHRDENLRVHLCLCGAGLHHHHLLRPDDHAAEERPAAVRLQREGQELAAHYTHGPGGRGSFHHLLDPHPHLHNCQDCGGNQSQEPVGNG